MRDNAILTRNEYGANRLAAKIMLATIFFVALVYVLELLGIFIVPLTTMTIAMSIAAFLLIVPSIIVFIFKLDNRGVKYIVVSAAALMVATLTVFLSYHVVILFVYPIALASLYFSRKLSWYAVLFSVAVVTAAQLLSLNANGAVDKNLTNSFELLVYGVVPRGIQLIALALIFILLSKRTRGMLRNAVGAEEQKSMLNRLKTVTDKSHEVSSVLVQSVKQLSEITDHTTKANEQIAGNAGKVAGGSENTLKLVDEATTAIESISESLKKVAEESSRIADISKELSGLTTESGAVIKDAVDTMREIDAVTDESKQIITRLGTRSNEIGKIVSIISGISGQTNMLALNAAIESARAGEQGKGFAVVATEIRALAEQSEKAARDIARLIKDVIEDTEKAVDAMDKNSGMVEKGLQVINMAGETFDRVSKAGSSMNGKVQEVSGVTNAVAAGSGRIVSIVRDIREINHGNMVELQEIAAASEQQLASMQQVASSVSHIETISSELLEAVGEN